MIILVRDLHVHLHPSKCMQHLSMDPSHAVSVSQQGERNFIVDGLLPENDEKRQAADEIGSQHAPVSTEPGINSSITVVLSSRVFGPARSSG